MVLIKLVRLILSSFFGIEIDKPYDAGKKVITMVIGDILLN